jgi:hypothetical protein
LPQLLSKSSLIETLNRVNWFLLLLASYFYIFEDFKAFYILNLPDKLIKLST